MAKKNMNVKNLAERYGLSAKEVLAELDAQGFHGMKSFSAIPADSEELILAYFDELAAKKAGGSGSDSGKVSGPEVHIKAPIIVKTLAFGEAVAGFPSIMCAIFLLGGLQLFCIGVLGQYLSKTYLETKQRPIYIVRETEQIYQERKAEHQD